MTIIEAHRMHWCGSRRGFQIGAHWGPSMWTGHAHAVTIELVQWRLTIGWGE
jgi:hypothetical protein